MSKRKLLLADDSITIQKVVNLTFADEGIEVVAVSDGDSAMHKFDEFIPDLVMADVNMPGLSGYEVCQIIKQNEETQHIPVILLVGSFEPFDEETARKVGADDYLTKPFQSIRQLVNKVTDLLNAGGAARVAEAPAAEDDYIDADEDAELSRNTIEISPNTIEIPPIRSEADAADVYAAPSTQFEDTLRYENPADVPADFGDAGMDDDMIETTNANEYAAPVHENETATDYGKTQPLNAADLKDFSIVGDRDDAPADDAAAVNEDSLYDEPAVDYAEAPAVPSVETSTPESDAAATEEFDDAAEPEVAEATETPADEAAVAGSFEEPTAPEQAAADEVESPSAAEAADEAPVADAEGNANEEVEAPVAEETANEEVGAPVADVPAAPAIAAQVAPLMSDDDGDLLELPPLVEETGIRSQPVVQPPPAPVAAVAEETPAAEPSEAASSAAFPPELIEAIAKRVAEQISAKTLSDVLPQITELVMKKMSEEKKD